MSQVLILCATRPEMAWFLDQHAATIKEKVLSGLTVYSGILGPTSFDCVISGPGVFNTAHALTVYLEHARPLLILDTGIAGVFADSGLCIGDIAIATQEQYIHIGCNSHSPLPFDLIENQPLTRKGIYPIDAKRVKPYHRLLARKFPGTAAGNFITVSSITDSFEHAQEIYTDFSPVMEAMEGAAALHVAALYKVPAIEIRTASNLVGEQDKGKWNFPLAFERLGQMCEVILRHPL